MMVGDFVDHEIHNRAINVDLAFYESPEYFDSLELARKGGAQRPAQVVSGVLMIFRSAAFLIAVLVLIAGIDWRLLPVMLIAMFAALIVRVRFTKKLFNWYRDFIQLERRSSYLDDLMTSNLHAKEIRFGGLGPYLKDSYSDLRARIRREHLAIERRRTVAELIVAIIGVLVFAGATAYLVLEAIDGRLSVGDMVLFVLLFRRAEGSGKEFIMHLSQLYDDRLYLGQLFSFLSVEPNIAAPSDAAPITASSNASLKFNGVSFKYPGVDTLALKEIDLEIRPGQIVALVGANGSGKTSLIKLATRLYDATSGKITLEGKDIKTFDPVAYRKLFSIVFQDFSKYSDTARDNIRYQDIGKGQVAEDIESAARKAGAESFIKKLVQGYDTPLTRMFDGGQELSIGQWQRLALARAFFSDSKFMILDEPSSALDPEFEFALFENFRDRLGDRGALLISHRLSTVCMADYTYVLDNGVVVEHGTHKELIARQGHYAGLFEKQGRNYRN
jgi:ATP-binding cassette subfamily B protein